MSKNNISAFPKPSELVEVNEAFKSGDKVEASKINSVFYTLSQSATQFLSALAIATSNTHTYDINDSNLYSILADDLLNVKVNNAENADYVNMKDKDNQIGDSEHPNYIDGTGHFKKSNNTFIYARSDSTHFTIPNGYYFTQVTLGNTSNSVTFTATQINVQLDGGTHYTYTYPNVESGTLATEDDVNGALKELKKVAQCQQVTKINVESDETFVDKEVTFKNISKDDFSFFLSVMGSNRSSQSIIAYASITKIKTSGSDVVVGFRLYRLNGSTEESLSNVTVSVLAVRAKNL